MKTSLKLLGGLLVAVATVGCASVRPDSQPLMVQVENDMVPPGGVTIFLMRDNGQERELGQITSGRHTLRYSGIRPVGTQSLIARRNDGRYIQSTSIVIDDVTGLEWRLATNTLRVTSTRAKQ